MSIEVESQNNPTLKGRFLNLEVIGHPLQKLAKKMKSKLGESDKKIKQFVAKNEEGT